MNVSGMPLLVGMMLLSSGGEESSTLPAGFFPGTARLRLEVDGRAVRVPLPAAWATGDELSVSPLEGIRIRLERGEDGSRGAVTWLDLRPAPRARCRVRLEIVPHLDGRGRSAWLSGPAGRVARLVAAGGEGLDFARGLYVAATDQGFDLSATWEGISIRRIEGPGSGRAAFALAGETPAGREVSLLGWEVRSDVLSGQGWLPPVGGRASGARAVGSPLLSSPGILSAGDVPAEELLRIARSLHLALGGEGPVYVELGDGWQADARRLLRGPGRDWSRPDPKAFPDGISVFARTLREASGTLGLWLVPFGTSRPGAFEERPEAYVRDAKGRVVHGGWLGAAVLDPTVAPGRERLRALVDELRKEQVGALRLAGLGRTLDFFRLHQPSLGDRGVGPVGALERGLATLRDAAGAEMLLLGDSDTPDDALGFLDGVRCGVAPGDRGSRWERDLAATARRSWLKGRLLDVEAPLLGERPAGATLGTAGVAGRLALAALTGQRVMLDPSWLGATDLDARAVETLRALPDVRPLAMAPRAAPPDAWVVEVGSGPASRPHLIVGLFPGRDGEGARRLRLGPGDLSIDGVRTDRWILVDRTRGRLHGRSSLPIDFWVEAGEHRLLALYPDLGRPQVVGIDGRGWSHARRLVGVRWDPRAAALTGRLDLRERETREVWIFCPPAWDPEEATAGGSPVDARRDRSLLRLRLERVPDDRTGGAPPEGDATGIGWSVRFRPRRPADVPRLDRPPSVRPRLGWSAQDRRPRLTWDPDGSGYLVTDRYAVYRDGTRVGTTTDCRFIDLGARPGATHRYGLRAERDPAIPVRDDDGGPRVTSPDGPMRELTYSPPPPRDAWLSDWAASVVRTRTSGTVSGIVYDASATGSPLVVRGKRYERGIGVWTPTAIGYELGGAYSRFEARVGIDDGGGLLGRAVFVVRGDGRELYRSEEVTGSDKDLTAVAVDVAGVGTLTLEVTAAPSPGETVPADWIEPRVLVDAAHEVP